jgi:integrase
MIGRQGNQDQYLKKLGHTWYVSVRVPRTLKKLVGNTHIRRSLQTRDKSEANLRKHSVVGGIKTELARLRMNPQEANRDGLSFTAAKAIRAELVTLDNAGDRDTQEAITGVALDRAVEVERLYGPEKAQRWYRVATTTSDTLADLMDKWLAVSDYKESTNLGHRKALGEVLEYLKNPDAHPEDIDRKRAVSYIAEDLVSRGLAHSTIRDKLNSLIGFWDWIASQGVIPTGINPWTRHKVSKANNKGRSAVKRAYAEAELLVLLKGNPKAKKWPTMRYIPDLLVLGLYSGCREEEICSLTGDKVELHKSYVILSITDAKTQAGIRPVAITNAAALSIIKRRLKAAGETGQLFPELKRGGADKRFSFAASKAYMRFRRLCDIPEGTDFHSLRRCVITVLENARVSQVDIARFVGHKVGTMAADRYSAGSSKERAVETAKKVRYSKAIEAATKLLVTQPH